jgi:NTE family protein
MGRPRTAFVLSGITADLLLGTSVGALNASFVESAPQVPARARELARICRDLRREDAFPVSIYTLVGGFCGTRDHLVSNHVLRRLHAVDLGDQR